MRCGSPTSRPTACNTLRRTAPEPRWAIRSRRPRSGVNSFGFGGTNGHAILEAAPEPAVTARRPAERADAGDTRDATDRLAWMLPLSARSQSALSDLARRYLDALGDERGLQRAA